MNTWNDLSLRIYSTFRNEYSVGFNVKNIFFGETPLMIENLIINVMIVYAGQYNFHFKRYNDTKFIWINTFEDVSC